MTPSRIKALCITGALAAAFLNGVAAQYFYPDDLVSPADVAFGLLSAAFVLGWYIVDSNARGYRRSPFLGVFIVLITIVALPYYLFHSRGAKRGALAVLVCIALGAAWMVLLYAGALSTYLATT